MGWKTVKDHYEIDWIVHADAGKVYVGSPYVHDLLTIYPDGNIQRNVILTSGMHRIIQLAKQMEHDKDLLIGLLQVEDEFEKAIPVYTWREGAIIACKCEELGWPNVTHDGQIMYENRFFPDRASAVQAALDNARSSLPVFKQRVDEARTSLKDAEVVLTTYQAHAILYAAEAAAVGLSA